MYVLPVHALYWQSCFLLCWSPHTAHPASHRVRCHISPSCINEKVTWMIWIKIIHLTFSRFTYITIRNDYVFIYIANGTFQFNSINSTIVLSQVNDFAKCVYIIYVDQSWMEYHYMNVVFTERKNIITWHFFMDFHFRENIFHTKPSVVFPRQKQSLEYQRQYCSTVLIQDTY